MSHHEKRPVTIEDLLRLKSAERPPAEFWERFDRELRAKQLAALVQKRPWWQTLPRFVTGWRRYHFPLGATAVLAVTFISLRDSSPVVPASGSEASPAQVVAVASAASAERAAVAVDSHAKSVSVPEAAPAFATLDLVSKDSVLLAIESAELRADSSALVATALTGKNSQEQPAPSARHMAANFAAARASDPVLGRGLLGAAAMESRPLVARGATVEPLAQMTPPGDARRARIISLALAASADVSNRAVSSRAGERATRDLSDERMNDSIRRFNAKGNGFSVKL